MRDSDKRAGIGPKGCCNHQIEDAIIRRNTINGTIEGDASRHAGHLRLIDWTGFIGCFNHWSKVDGICVRSHEEAIEDQRIVHHTLQ